MFSSFLPIISDLYGTGVLNADAGNIRILNGLDCFLEHDSSALRATLLAFLYPESSTKVNRETFVSGGFPLDTELDRIHSRPDIDHLLLDAKRHYVIKTTEARIASGSLYVHGTSIVREVVFNLEIWSLKRGKSEFLKAAEATNRLKHFALDISQFQLLVRCIS